MPVARRDLNKGVQNPNATVYHTRWGCHEALYLSGDNVEPTVYQDGIVMVLVLLAVFTAALS